MKEEVVQEDSEVEMIEVKEEIEVDLEENSVMTIQEDHVEIPKIQNLGGFIKEEMIVTETMIEEEESHP